jgi:alkanesulfonate monooxygenase SsuD/methylene tetrahydromethanopterin reductase-like flavin-dependent oxidoreductase (luciferase family)
LIPFFFGKTVDEALGIAASAIRTRPEVSINEYCALGPPEQIRKKLQQYIEAGATKFVMRPSGPQESWREQVERLAKEVIPGLQTPFAQAERLERLG